MNKETPVDICKSNDSLKNLYPHFSNKSEALHFYAEFMGYKYSRDVTDVCEICSSKKKVSPYIFEWKAYFSTVSTVLGSVLGTLAGSSIGVFYSESMVQYFATHHNLCKRCALKVKFMNGLGYLLSNVGFGILFLSLIVLISSIVLGVVLLNTLSKREMSLIMIATLVGIIGVGLTILFCRGGHKISILSSFRQIGRKPFFLNKITKGHLIHH